VHSREVYDPETSLDSAEPVDNIREIMVRKVVTTDPDVSLARTAELMVEKGRLVGIITESDFMRFTSTGRDMQKTKVGDHMRKRAITCDPSSRILRALMTMKKQSASPPDSDKD